MQKAAEFFIRKSFRIQPLVFVCNSRLLFPVYKDILPEYSNIRAFMNDFDVYKTTKTTEISGESIMEPKRRGFENLPENTGLENGLIKWLMDGHMAGYARGGLSVPSGIKRNP